MLPWADPHGFHTQSHACSKCEVSRISFGKWWPFQHYLTSDYLPFSWDDYTKNPGQSRTFYTISRPFMGLWALDWPTLSPSMSQRYCCGVRLLTSLLYRGHWRISGLQVFVKQNKSMPAQYRALILSHRPLQKRDSILVDKTRFSGLFMWNFRGWIMVVLMNRNEYTLKQPCI